VAALCTDPLRELKHSPRLPSLKKVATSKGKERGKEGKAEGGEKGGKKADAPTSPVCTTPLRFIILKLLLSAS